MATGRWIVDPPPSRLEFQVRRTKRAAAMTSERSRAYTRVIETIDEPAPAALYDLERRRVRKAADALLFARAGEDTAFDALSDIEHLTQRLVSCGRWSAERAGRLADDVAACGPGWADGLPAGRAA
jgi:hypothetical protein